MVKDDKKARGVKGEDFKFEKAMKELERLVAKLEKGDLPLEENLKAFEEGVRLVRACREYLDKTRQRIEMLVGDEKGKPVYEDIEMIEEEDELEDEE
jgi:exodeoxyribonuclease VII small subunit